MNWRALDILDSTLYKGLAILLIVTHNFMHLFPKPLENEFSFHPGRIFDFLHLAFSEPENIIRLTLAFFGHYGVQIFIFLSAYGLTKKYLQKEPAYGQFLWQRMLKIYPAFIVAILAWLIVEGWILGDYGVLGPIKVLCWNIIPLLLKLSLLSNFFMELSLQPVGPWWFIPFIFQFYLVFPFLRHLHAWHGSSGLLAISIASVWFSFLVGGKVGELNLYFTVLGHLPELCLGIYLANQRQSTVHFSKSLILMALVVFALGNFYEVFWYFSHITSLIILLVCFSALTAAIRTVNSTKRVVVFFGEFSMLLFLVNGFLREPYIHWAIFYDHWFATLVLCLASLATSILFAYALTNPVNRMTSQLNVVFPRLLLMKYRNI